MRFAGNTETWGGMKNKRDFSRKPEGKTSSGEVNIKVKSKIALCLKT
jgi:hypothetical protein